MKVATLNPKPKKETCVATLIKNLIQREQIKMISDPVYFEKVVTELSAKKLLPKINYENAL